MTGASALSRDGYFDSRSHIQSNDPQRPWRSGANPERTGRKCVSGGATSHHADRHTCPHLPAADVPIAVLGTLPPDQRADEPTGEGAEGDVIDARSAVAADDLEIGEITAPRAASARDDDQRVRSRGVDAARAVRAARRARRPDDLEAEWLAGKNGHLGLRCGAHRREE